jgi:hypothetical protein
MAYVNSSLCLIRFARCPDLVHVRCVLLCAASSAPLRGRLQPVPNDINLKLAIQPVSLELLPDVEYRIGKENADMLVTFTHMSKHHATFLWSSRDRVLRVKDEKSRNKTYIAVRPDIP